MYGLKKALADAKSWILYDICYSTDFKSLKKASVFRKTNIPGKLLKMSHLKFSILASSTNFCPFRTDLSGNAIWPQASDFYNFTKLTILMNFCPIKMVNETFSVIFNHCVLKMSVPFLKNQTIILHSVSLRLVLT